MSDELKFRISSGLKNIIGRDLITDEYIAVFELVKNSFDAHATEVEIIFENIFTPEGKIIIMDNGKGMNHDDLINKWLFVAYSAKKDGTEDLDYRDKINSRFYYAGAKGIGRFSCDKLGTNLRLVSKKDESHSKIEQIKVDWTKFEENAKDEFINISVEHEELEVNPSKFETGTYLEISGLRRDANWDAEKILRLKHSLAKLINPFEADNNRKFKITILANEFIDFDINQTNLYRKINGIVENNLLEILKFKTIKILTTISPDGNLITTELSENGQSLYKIVEKNSEYNLLNDILVELYYLDRRAKYNFTKLMGVRSHEYGSVFLYKNDIRIYPFGEPGQDPLGLDLRQQKRLGDFVGTSQLIGRIGISGDNDEFRETTSRGDGLIKNSSYSQLLEFLIDKVIVKLENYLRYIGKYGIDIDDYGSSDAELTRLVRTISGVHLNSDIIDIQFNPDILLILNTSLEENSNAKSILKSIEKIAIDSNNDDLLDKISKVKNTLNDAVLIAELAEEDLKIKEREIKENQTQNLFLKSLKSQDFLELVSLMHHIGISSGIISNYIKYLTYKIDKNIEITNDELKEIFGILNLENQKILSISRFATKANFKMNAENQRLDLIGFISEYIENIAIAFNNTINIEIEKNDEEKFITNFKPIEMTIIIDNLINNSRKAFAKTLKIKINVDQNLLIVKFIDDGIGIPKSIRNKIFDFGFTTTGGSGLGLTHLKEIVNNIKGVIELNNNIEKGTEFKLTFKK